MKNIERFVSKMMIPRKCECTFCNNKFYRYVTHGIDSYASKTYNTVCMGRRNSDCPYCGCVDKYRWLWWIIQNKTKICDPQEKSTILHFAPERGVASRIKEVNFNNEYISGDIEPGKADEIVDMTNIQYDDETFDYVIASMVMEHIIDEKKALNELVRVIKNDGKILLSVPMALNLSVTQDDILDSGRDRHHYYGEDDHVRLYGTDIVDRWIKLIDKKVRINKWCPIDELGKKNTKKMGIPPYYYIWCIEKTIDNVI